MKNSDLLRAFGEIDDKYILAAAPEQQRQYNTHSPIIMHNWKKYFSVAVCAAALVAVILPLSKNIGERPMENPSSSGSESSENPILIANPYEECNTLAEAADITGFTLDIPEELNGCRIAEIIVWDGTMIEANYSDNTMIRKGKSKEEDISGDYNDYDETQDVTINEIQVSISGNDNQCYKAIWNTDDYCYAISTPVGFTLEDMTELIKQIQ